MVFGRTGRPKALYTVGLSRSFHLSDGGTEQQQCAHPHIQPYGVMLFPGTDQHGTFFIPIYAFLCLGVGSLAFVQVLFFLPFLWLVMMFYLMAFSHKNFWASILGITLPYWLLAPVAILSGNLDMFISHFSQIAQFQPLFQYQQLNDHHVVTLLFVVVLAVIGTIHYLRRSYLDKIRNRMLYFSFMMVGALALVFVILQPQHIEPLTCIIIINTCPLIAHFIALTHTRATNMLFCLIIACILLLTAYNLWIPSLLF